MPWPYSGLCSACTNMITYPIALRMRCINKIRGQFLVSKAYFAYILICPDNKFRQCFDTYRNPGYVSREIVYSYILVIEHYERKNESIVRYYFFTYPEFIIEILAWQQMARRRKT